MRFLELFHSNYEPRVSGDKPIDTKGKFIFLFGNLIANFVGAFSILRVKTLHIHSPFVFGEKRSPLRILIDDFLSLRLTGLLGSPKSISVLEIGGGSGYTRGILARAGFKGSYTAVDPVADDRFLERGDLAFESELIKEPFENFSSKNKFDLILSVTSLEHVEDDEICVRNSKNYLTDNGLEVHIVPGGWTLPCYLWHGYRQFSRGRIKGLFKDRRGKVNFYALGGIGTLLLQFFGITTTERWLKKKIRGKSVYGSLLRLSYFIDRVLPICPSIYIAVYHNVKSDLI